MSVKKTSLTVFPCVLGSVFPIIRVCSGLSFATKGFGHLAALYLLLLLVARYNLSYHKTICYHLFQYLQRIPCWKPLIISFCSSLGSTLLLIKRTTIDPLHLWVISRSQQSGAWISFFARTHFLACEDVAGGSQQSGANIFSWDMVARLVGPRCQVEE